MKRYRVTLTGGPTAMLMHADDVAKADALSCATQPTRKQLA